MKPTLALAAARRLADQRKQDETGPVRTAQKALYAALLRGDLPEALRQSDIVVAIRGPQPPSPMALKLIERLNRMAAAAVPAGADQEWESSPSPVPGTAGSSAAISSKTLL